MKGLRLPDSWVKVLVNSALMNHPSDATFHAEVIQTLWTLSSLDDQSKSRVKDCGGLEFTVKAMKKFESASENAGAAVQVHGCGLLSCLLGSDRHAASVWKTKGVVARILTVVTLCSDNDSYGVRQYGIDSATMSKWGLRALFYLSASKAKLGETVPKGNDFWSELQGWTDGAFGGVLQAMKRHRSSLGVQLWACRLLWSLSVQSLDEIKSSSNSNSKRFEEEKHEIGNVVEKFEISHEASSSAGSLVQGTQDLVDTVCAALRVHAKDSTMVTAALGLLCTLTVSSSILTSTPKMEAVVTAVVNAMKTQPKDKTVLRYACLVLSNLCYNFVGLSVVDAAAQNEGEEGIEAIATDVATDEARSAIPRLGGVEAVLDILNNHNTDLDMQADACHTLTCLCVDSDISKNVTAKELKSLVGIYQSQVGKTSVGAGKVQDQVCQLLASLAINPELAMKVNRSGIMVLLIKDSFKDGKIKVNGKEERGMPVVMLNLLISNSTANDMRVQTEATSTVIKYALANYCTAEEAESVMTMLCSLTSSKDCADVLISSSCRTPESKNLVPALDRIYTAMQSFQDSALLQSSACGILSNLYALFRGGHRHGEDIISYQMEVELIARALCLHRSQESVQEQAFLSLRNFCCSMPHNFVTNKDIMRVLMSAIDEAIRSMAQHPTSVFVQQNAVGFVWALANISFDVCVKIAQRQDSVPSISNTMLLFPESIELQREVLGALASLASVSSTHLLVGSLDSVVTIIKCMEIHLSDQGLIETGCFLLAAISNDNYHVKSNIAESEDSISGVIGCMMAHPMSAAIQESSCAILTHITFDNYIKECIANEGGLNSVLKAMDNHSGDPIVMSKACEALANIIGGVSDEILRTNNVPQRIVSVMDLYPDVATIQEMCLLAFWNFSNMTEELKQEVFHCGGLRSIVDCMGRYVGSELVQEKGCTALWGLSISDASQREVGVAGGIEAIIIGALAHIKSSPILHEAFGALRSLAGNHDNKMRIRDSDGVGMIVGAMWVQHHISDLLSSACSILSIVAVNVDTNEVMPLKPEVLEVVISAMRGFPDHNSLQEQCCILLRNYTFRPSNIPMMRENPLLFELLAYAASNHPLNCSERVQFILNELLQ